MENRKKESKRERERESEREIERETEREEIERVWGEGRLRINSYHEKF